MLDAVEEPKTVSTTSEWVDDLPLKFEKIIDQYSITGTPVEVNFRSLVPYGSGIDRATHLFHSYPAKLLPNIPFFFLNCGLLEEAGSVVYDPFCGTGTVLVEALVSGHKAAGADSNPLARKISRAKTSPIPLHIISAELEAVSFRAKTISPAKFSPVVDVGKWFTDEAQVELGRLREAIRLIDNEVVREFFEVSFSQCVKKVSLADPRNSVPVRRKDDLEDSRDISKLFIETATQNAKRLQRIPSERSPVWISTDARHILGADTAGGLEADIVITSPPYAGAQKYIRASSLSLGWLGLAPDDRLRNLETLNIGREHLTKDEQNLDKTGFSDELISILEKVERKNKLRASIFGLYIQEMRSAIAASVSSLKSGGYFVLVIGDNQVCGYPVQTSKFIKELLEREGLTVKVEMVDAINSRGLMTKRNKTAGIISHEHVIVFKKPNG